MKRTALTVAIAVAAMVASTAAALAIEAVVTRDSPVYRSRTSNVVVNEVDRNQIVEVLECRSDRCRIRIPGPDGWVRQSRLAPLDDDGDAQPNVPFRFGITIGPGGPSVSIGIGEGGGSSGGPTSGARACFYQHVNYGGASFCLAPGQSRNNFATFGWNDVVSSIRLFGGARVQVCQHANFGGTCATYNSSRSSLGGLNDQISSAEVY